jgi:hypothetical protein
VASVLYNLPVPLARLPGQRNLWPELDARFAVTLNFHSALHLSDNCLSIKPYQLFGNKKSENNDDLSVLASTKS